MNRTDLSIPIAVSYIAESHPGSASIAVTNDVQMMRYRGKFQRTAYPNIQIDPSDEGKVLEEKWKRWYELEGWKRYVGVASQSCPFWVC